MALLEFRGDDSEIAERCLAPANRAASLIDDMKWPAYRWRNWLRHLYVLTWPLSLLTRIMLFVVIGVTWVALGLAGIIAARLAYIWVGERSPWE